MPEQIFPRRNVTAPGASSIIWVRRFNLKSPEGATFRSVLGIVAKGRRSGPGVREAADRADRPHQAAGGVSGLDLDQGSS